MSRAGTKVYDYAHVAELARWAHARNLSMAGAIAQHYGSTDRAGTAAIMRARTMGYDIPLQVGWNNGSTVAPHGSPAAYDRHLRHKEEPCQPCKDAHNRRRAAQRASIRRDTVTFTGDSYTFTPVSLVRLLCDCGEVFGDCDALTRHTLSAHGRRPSVRERTPT